MLAGRVIHEALSFGIHLAASLAGQFFKDGDAIDAACIASRLQFNRGGFTLLGGHRLVIHEPAAAVGADEQITIPVGAVHHDADRRPGLADGVRHAEDDAFRRILWQGVLPFHATGHVDL